MLWSYRSFERVSQKTYKEVRLPTGCHRADDWDTETRLCAWDCHGRFLMQKKRPFPQEKEGIGTEHRIIGAEKRRAETLESHAAKWHGGDDPPRDECAAFDLKNAEGRRFYESVPDEQLLKILQQTAAQLGHSPAQKEIFWVYREYIKRRFGKWPYALRQAGLHTAAGKGGMTQTEAEAEQARIAWALERVRQCAGDLGRVPHPSDLPAVCEALRHAFRSWNEVLDAAEVRCVRTVSRIDNLDAQTCAHLAELLAQAKALGRAPLRDEVEQPRREALIARCGSWRNALFQIGLEPVTHITPFANTRLDMRKKQAKKHGDALYNCLYRVLAPSAETAADLAALCALARKLGRSPSRKDVSPELRKRLQASCGSWANAVFQLQYIQGDLDKDGNKKEVIL